MICGCKTGWGILVLPAILCIFMQIFAATCFAANSMEERLTLIIRPELLPEAPSLYSNVVVPARNPFIWPAKQKAKIERFDSGFKRVDPFAELILNGIISVNDTLVVIINNTQLQEGDMIGGVRIREIARDYVIVATKKNRRTLRFPSSEIDFSIIPKAEAK